MNSTVGSFNIMDFLAVLEIHPMPWTNDGQGNINDANGKQVINFSFTKYPAVVDFFWNGIQAHLMPKESSNIDVKGLLSRYPAPWYCYHKGLQFNIQDANECLLASYAITKAIPFWKEYLQLTQEITVEELVKTHPTPWKFPSRHEISVGVYTDAAFDNNNKLITTSANLGGYDKMQKLINAYNTYISSLNNKEIDELLTKHRRPWKIVQGNVIWDADNHNIKTGVPLVIEQFYNNAKYYKNVDKFPLIIDQTEKELEHTITQHPLPWKISNNSQYISCYSCKNDVIYNAITTESTNKLLSVYDKVMTPYTNLIADKLLSHPRPWKYNDNAILDVKNQVVLKDATASVLYLHSIRTHKSNMYPSLWERTPVELQHLIQHHPLPWKEQGNATTYAIADANNIIIASSSIKNEIDQMRQIRDCVMKDYNFKCLYDTKIVELWKTNPRPWSYDSKHVYNKDGKVIVECGHNLLVKNTEEIKAFYEYAARQYRIDIPPDLWEMTEHELNDYMKKYPCSWELNDYMKKYPCPWELHQYDNSLVVLANQGKNNLVAINDVENNPEIVKKVVEIYNKVMNKYYNPACIEHPTAFPWELDGNQIIDCNKCVVYQGDNTSATFNYYMSIYNTIVGMAANNTQVSLVTKWLVNHPLPWHMGYHNNELWLFDSKQNLICCHNAQFNKELLAKIAEKTQQLYYENASTLDKLVNKYPKPWKKDNNYIFNAQGKLLVEFKTEEETNSFWELACSEKYQMDKLPDLEYLMAHYKMPFYIESTSDCTFLRSFVGSIIINCCTKQLYDHAQSICEQAKEFYIKQTFNHFLTTYPLPWMKTKNEMYEDCYGKQFTLPKNFEEDIYKYSLDKYFSKITKDYDLLLKNHPAPWGIINTINNYNTVCECDANDKPVISAYFLPDDSVGMKKMREWYNTVTQSECYRNAVKKKTNNVVPAAQLLNENNEIFDESTIKIYINVFQRPWRLEGNHIVSHNNKTIVHTANDIMKYWTALKPYSVQGMEPEEETPMSALMDAHPIPWKLEGAIISDANGKTVFSKPEKEIQAFWELLPHTVKKFTIGMYLGKWVRLAADKFGKAIEIIDNNYVKVQHYCPCMGASPVVLRPDEVSVLKHSEAVNLVHQFHIHKQ